MDKGAFKRKSDVSDSEMKKKRFSPFAWVPKPIRRFWRKYNVTRILLLGLTVFLIFVTGYLFYLSKAANVGVLQQSLNAQTQIFDNKGQVAESLQGQKGTPVTFEQIPQSVKDAVVATEDRTFYTNRGVNFTRSLFSMVTLGKFGGGSTITQQLAKNAYLTQAQTIDRKAREVFLALQIAKHYSKNDVLTMYFNQNNFGNGAWGISDAAHKYFGKDVGQLTVGESATLVGLLKGPAIYNPIFSVQNATNRRNTVLQNMVNAGYLKQEDANQYMQEDLSSELSDDLQPKNSSYKYPSYDNSVVAEAENTYHLSYDQIINGGYKIYTGLDQNMQAGLQQTYSSLELFPQASDGTYAQSASVATDPKTGQVRALIGSLPVAGSSPFTDLNYATRAQRSPGSAIKPLIVYTPAIETGWAIDKTVQDAPTNYNGWQPLDADGQWHGDMPMYQALANSYNIPAINTYQTLTPAKGNAKGREFGLELNSKNDILPTALGSGVETSPWQMSQAYSAFASGGTMHTNHLITKIEDAAGNLVASAQDSNTQVMSADTASKMTQMMLGTYTNGSAWNAAPSTYAMAGKTGTNEDIDQWVIGYTPDVVMALWVGFANPSDPAYRLQGTSEDQTSVIFRQEASYILPYTLGTAFSEQNAYLAHGIGPITPAWTAQRSVQDQIVLNEQAQAGTTGNSASSSSSSSNATSNSGIGKTLQDFWSKLTGLFK